MDIIIAKYNYLIFVILLMIGLWAMMAKNNLVKKIIGMSIFQTAVILFYISIGTKEGSTIPILEHGHEVAGHVENVIHAADYANPLTQILMLTAIVVGVSTLGVALGLIQKIYKESNLHLISHLHETHHQGCGAREQQHIERRLA